MENDDLVCRHMRLTKGQILDVIRDHNISSFDALQDETNVATICGSCRADVEEILEDEINNRNFQK